MVALAQHRDSLCPLCGRPIEVCTDPVNEPRWESGQPTRCHATTAVRRAMEPYQKKAKHPEALLFGAHLNTS